MPTLIGFTLNKLAFENASKEILSNLGQDASDEAIYDFIMDEEFNRYKDTYFPGLSSLDTIIITRYTGMYDTMYIGYLINPPQNLSLKQSQLQTFLKSFSNSPLLSETTPDSYTINDL